MKNFFNKILFKSNNLEDVGKKIRDFSKNTPVKKIFDAVNSYSLEGEIRYVGGFTRKIINGEKVDDIDLATNLEPKDICAALKKKDIDFFESGVEHGTITAKKDKYKFEITTLRKDIFTDGRHAKVEFSKDWKEDAFRRDFTFNSIYSDQDGNLFDPFNGKDDLKNGIVKFLGYTEKRIKEDYLRTLRYLRFFLNYSKTPHNPNTIKVLKKNIHGNSKLSKERLLDELKKIIKLDFLERLSRDKLCLELIIIIFPELKNIKRFSNLNPIMKNLLQESDFIFLLSLMIIDESDNADYFLYRFKISKKDQKRIRIIDEFFKQKIDKKSFTEENMNKVFYYNGKNAVDDILKFKIFKSKKFDKKLEALRKIYNEKTVPKMPIGADILINKYQIPEGKQLGSKLKMIEEKWVNNNFRISEQQVENIINN